MKKFLLLLVSTLFALPAIAAFASPVHFYTVNQSAKFLAGIKYNYTIGDITNPCEEKEAVETLFNPELANGSDAVASITPIEQCANMPIRLEITELKNSDGSYSKLDKVCVLSLGPGSERNIAKIGFLRNAAKWYCNDQTFQSKK